MSRPFVTRLLQALGITSAERHRTRSLRQRRFRTVLQEGLEARQLLTTTWGISVGSTTEPTQSGQTTPLAGFIWVSPAPQQPMTFRWWTSDGTATDGSDYTGQASGYVQVSNTSSSASISVPVVFDQNPESNETVQFHVQP